MTSFRVISMLIWLCLGIIRPNSWKTQQKGKFESDSAVCKWNQSSPPARPLQQTIQIKVKTSVDSFKVSFSVKQWNSWDICCVIKRVWGKCFESFYFAFWFCSFWFSGCRMLVLCTVYTARTMSKPEIFVSMTTDSNRLNEVMTGWMNKQSYQFFRCNDLTGWSSSQGGGPVSDRK